MQKKRTKASPFLFRSDKIKLLVGHYDLISFSLYNALDELIYNGTPSADSGFDVLAHALEAWVGKNANPITDALAKDAFRTAMELLHPSFQGDQSVRLS